ncbi:MAG: hypothetical protein ACYDDA_11210 [Acidiferrobacteraceae bacterium]
MMNEEEASWMFLQYLWSNLNTIAQKKGDGDDWSQIAEWLFPDEKDGQLGEDAEVLCHHLAAVLDLQQRLEIDLGIPEPPRAHRGAPCFLAWDRPQAERVRQRINAEGPLGILRLH